ncbi:MAG: hypothetical protein GX235_10195 [Clostridiales bacterium]|nr:hypothetical protein [Clostridiales bacterium]
MKMRSRERMLYGTDTKYDQDELPLYARGYYGEYKDKKENELYALENKKEDMVPHSFSSFRLRLIIAVLLFAGFLFLDTGEGNIAGITTTQLKEEINRDFDTGLDEVVFDFEHNFPYTLFNDKSNDE